MSDAPNPVLIGYARVSTDEQETALQRDALVGAGVDPASIYEEKASGAGGKKRPALAAALKDLRPGDTLVVWKLDRLGRNLSELIVTMKRLDEQGAELKVLSGLHVDTKSAAGRFIFQLFGALAEFEHQLILERTKAGLAAAAARGRKGGRRFKMTPATRAKAERMAKAGKTVQEIADACGVSKSTLHKHFPGGLPMPAHDPKTCEVL